MQHSRVPRKWIWLAVLVYVSGLAYDVVWHGVLGPGFEARTVAEMARWVSTIPYELLCRVGNRVERVYTSP